MKGVKVHWPAMWNDKTSIMILIENEDDYRSYLQVQSDKLSQDITTAIRSKAGIESWDHLTFKTGTMHAAVAKAHIKGTNPLFETGPISTEIEINQRCLLANGPILINDKGGYMSYHSDQMTLEDVVVPEHVHFAHDKESTTLVLENDETLDRNALKYIKGEKISLITSLRQVSDKNLRMYMKRFVDSGGNTLKVYTTGNDTDQMEDYLSFACLAGIERVHLFVTREPDNSLMFIESVYEDQFKSFIMEYINEN